MYDTIQFFCKAFILAGLLAFAGKVYDALFYKYSPFIIDGISRVDESPLKQERDNCLESTECSKLAEAVYYEARGEGWEGMKAVANVIKNRVESSKYSVQEVVERPWQFSYVHEVKDKSFKDRQSYEKSLLISYRVLTGKVGDNTLNSTHYLNPKKVKKLPKWAKQYERTVVINDHVFYRG